ncbi:MAG: ABC transporter ATP-binding protein [Chlamydiia bacterium]|nr:ABC transporter ATP-binding protein [Chlamydiia bacterium]
MNPPLLQCTHLSKTFLSPSPCAILKEINLTVHPGETVAIMGPSGVGKSTLLHILGTLDSPTGGTLEISGLDALKTPASLLRNKHIGFIFQNYNLLDEYSLLDNVMMPQKIAGIRDGEKRAKTLLEEVGLVPQMHHLAKQLSGGEKQRAAIARALCNDPDLILADEPTGNLDEENSDRIHSLLISTAKNRNKGLIIVTHDRSLANACDLLYTLHGGTLEKAR